MNRCWAVMPAAGVGSRMQADRPKQYLTISGKTVIEHSISALLKHPRIEAVAVSLSTEDSYWDSLARDFHKPVLVADGGAERCHSVINGLRKISELASPDDWVLVHDAARPCLQLSDIDALLDAVDNHDVGGLLGLPVADTLKRCDVADNVMVTVDRSLLWRALTPQMFRLGVLLDALQQAEDQNRLVTDEASAIEMMGLKPLMIEGRADNIKITRPQDLALASLYLQALEKQQ